MRPSKESYTEELRCVGWLNGWLAAGLVEWFWNLFISIRMLVEFVLAVLLILSFAQVLVFLHGF